MIPNIITGIYMHTGNYQNYHPSHDSCIVCRKQRGKDNLDRTFEHENLKLNYKMRLNISVKDKKK